MPSINSEPLFIKWNDELEEIIQQITVINNEAMLEQIPDDYRKVEITGLVETQEEVPESGQFYVDYKVGKVTFASDVVNGTTYSAHFYGKGIILIPAKRVYTNTTNPDAISNIQDMIDNYNNLNGVDLYTKFDPNAGHKHTGVAGDGAKIPAQYIPLSDVGNLISAQNVEDALQELKTDGNNNSNKIGDLNSLTTTNKSSLVSAINENVSQLAEKATKKLPETLENAIPAAGEIVRRTDGALAVGNGSQELGWIQRVGEDWNTFGLIESYMARGIPAPTLDVPTIGASPVTGGVTEPYNTANVTKLGCHPVEITAPYSTGTKSYIQNRSDSRTSAKAPWAVEFDFDGSDIAVLLHSHVTNPRYWIWVDGKPVGRTRMEKTGADPGETYDGAFNVRMTWTTAKKRRIRLYFADCDFGEITHPTSTTVTATTPIETKKAVFLGDSWFDLDSDFKWPNHIPTLIGLFMGWQTMVNGISSTGYVNAGSVSESSIYGSEARLAPIIAYNPDYIIINGTINDDSKTGVGTAATTLYNRLATDLPNAKLIVIGREPVQAYYLNNPPQQYLDVRSAAQNAPNVLGFIDPMRETWFTGEGKVTAPIGSGNADWYVGNSTTHPSNVGVWYYAKRITEHILRLLDKDGSLV